MLPFAYGQAIQEIDLLFAQKKYEQVLAKARGVLDKDPGNAYANGIIASTYVRVAKYDSSIAFALKAIQLDNDSTFISGWAHYNLGLAYVYTGKREEGIAELKRAIAVDVTVNNVKSAKHILDSLGYKMPEKEYDKNYLPNWVTIQSPALTYKFQDTEGCTATTYKFMQVHDSAYRQLVQIFQPALPGGVLMHVWSDPEIAKTVLHRRLGFAFAKQCFCHVSRHQTVGHELAHIISYWSWGTANSGYSKFISEGIGVCFDLEPRDKYAAARFVVGKYNVATLKVWENEQDYDDDVLYPLGGAFIQYMKEHSTPEQFRLLVKRQTLAEVRIIYGAQFDTMVADFDKLMGVKG